MSDPNENIDYVKAAVDDLLPIGFKAKCVENGSIVTVTLTKDDLLGKEASFTVKDTDEADSDGMEGMLRLAMGRAAKVLNDLAGKKVKRTAKKGKKAKAKKKAKRVKLIDASPELQKDVDDALEPVE